MKVVNICFYTLLLSIGITGCSRSDNEPTLMTDGVQVNAGKNGAAKDEVTYTTKEGKATVSGDNNSMKIETDKGSASMGAGTVVTEEEFGVAFYPGSQDKPGTSLKSETKDEKDYLVVRTTSDEPQKVVDFYKEKLKDITNVSSGEVQVVKGTAPNGAIITVSVQKKDGTTEINSSSVQKSKS